MKKKFLMQKKKTRKEKIIMIFINFNVKKNEFNK